MNWNSITSRCKMIKFYKSQESNIRNKWRTWNKNIVQFQGYRKDRNWG